MKRLIAACALTLCAAVIAPSPGEITLRGHALGVTSVVWSHDGRHVISGSLDGTLRVWDVASAAPARVLTHGAEIYDVKSAPAGQIVASSGGDARIVLWDISKERQTGAIRLPKPALAIAFTAAGQIVAGCRDGIVRVIDIPSRSIRREIAVGGEQLAIAVSPDVRRLVTSMPAKVWDFTSGMELLSLRAYGDGTIAFAPHGELIVTGERTGGLRVFSPSGERLQSLPTELERHVIGRTGPETIRVNMPTVAVAFSADGSRVATGGSDRLVRLWTATAAGLQPLRTIEAHSMSVTGVAFSPDGEWIASSSLDHTVHLSRTR